MYEVRKCIVSMSSIWLAGKGWTAGRFTMINCIFWYFDYLDTLPHIWELSKTVFIIFLVQLGPELDGGGRGLLTESSPFLTWEWD